MFAYFSPVFSNGDSLAHIFEVSLSFCRFISQSVFYTLYWVLHWEWLQDFDNPSVISSHEDLSLGADVDDKPLQYYLWMKRAADSSRGGGGRTKQLR